MDLRRIKVYVISTGKGKYEQRLRDTLERLETRGFQNVEHVESVQDVNPTWSLTKTNLLILEKAQVPFMIVEDDIQLEDEPLLISLPPPNAVAAYLGVSIWVYEPGKHIRPTTPEDTRSYDQEWVTIRGMTSAHAILFLDQSFLVHALVHIRAQINQPHDLVLATLQSSFPMYARKHPLFYQDKHQGGQEKETRLSWVQDRFITV